MAKTKKTRAKSAKKSAVTKKKISSTDVMLAPRQRAKVLKKLNRMSLPPSHPSEITGPALELGYEVPLPKPVKSKRTATKKIAKKAPRKKK